MQKRYFISARCETGEVIAVEIPAESFDDAREKAELRAEERFGMHEYRITSVVEQPDLRDTGPVALALRFASARPIGTRCVQSAIRDPQSAIVRR